MKLSLCILFLGLFAVSPALGQEPAPKRTDSRFVIDSCDDPNAGSCGDLDQVKSAGSRISFTIKIDRVVGETDSDGKLKYTQQMIENGVISQHVTLEISAFDIDSDFAENPECTPRERDRIQVNGQNIGENGAEAFLSGTTDAWRKVKFEIPIDLIRFGKWICDNQGNNCSWQGAGENYIDIDVSTAAPQPYQCGDITVNWKAKVDWGAISVKALYPVIMLHGYDSDGAFWTRQNFIQPFRNQKILYDDSINFPFNGKGSIVFDSLVMKSSIDEIARQKYHVNHVHLVAHSIGGLASRVYITSQPPKIAILTLASLSTPHHGTVLADFSLDFDEVGLLGAPFSGEDIVSGFILFVIQFYTRGDEALKNMRVRYLKNDFNPNPQNALPSLMKVDDEETPVRYFSFGADANLNNNYTRNNDPINGSAIIEGNEMADSPFEGRFQGRRAAERAYDLLHKNAETIVRYNKVPILDKLIPGIVEFIPNQPNQRPNNSVNDLFVTVGSSRYENPPSGAAFETQPRELHNHRRIAQPDIAQKVITLIKSVQP